MTKEPVIYVHRTALHEAGHAVACWLAHLPFGPARIHARGGGVHLDLNIENIEPCSDLALRLQVTYAAGAATLPFLYSMTTRYEAGGPDGDAIRQLGVPDAFTEEEWLTRLAWCARQLLEPYRPELAALAWRLDVRKTLSTNEIQSLLGSPSRIRDALDERNQRNGLPDGEERSWEHAGIARHLWPGDQA